MFRHDQVDLESLTVDDRYDLSGHYNQKIIGTLPSTSLASEEKTVLIRPREPIPFSHSRTLDRLLPQPLKKLFDIACANMQAEGFDLGHMAVYPLYQSGFVEPTDCLRAGFWHFDLMRNLRDSVPEGKMAFSIGYSATNILPTIFAQTVRNDRNTALPARRTIESEFLHERLGQIALDDDHIFCPDTEDIIRYDSLTLHRGRPNSYGRKIHRNFGNLSFCLKRENT